MVILSYRGSQHMIKTLSCSLTSLNLGGAAGDCAAGLQYVLLCLANKQKDFL